MTLSARRYKDLAVKITEAGITNASPEIVLPAFFDTAAGRIIAGEQTFDLASYNNIFVIGFGKVSSRMGLLVEKKLGTTIAGGIIISPEQIADPDSRIRFLKGSHPVTGQDSIAASRRLVELCSSARAGDLLICLISGGGSALFEILPDCINIDDYQILNRLLLTCGAPIEDINTVRKSFSLVKGGRLLQYIYPAYCLSFIISDVINDPLESIASGPTYQQTILMRHAYDVFARYGVYDKLPQSIRKYINSEMENERDKQINDINRTAPNHLNVIAANNMTALNASKTFAESFGLNTTIVSSSLAGEARKAAAFIAQNIRLAANRSGQNSKPVCLLFGGETTVTVTGNGKGGRNQELALALLREMQNSGVNYVFSSIGSDGIDGFTDAAGAVTGIDDYEKIRSAALNPEHYLDDNDSYSFFNRIGGLVRIKPYQTNIMDIMTAIIWPPDIIK